MQRTAGYQDEINEHLLNSLAAPCSVLHFWKCNIGKYPILSRIARDILAVQVSSVQPEREFSVAGNLITEIRNRLNPLAAVLHFVYVLGIKMKYFKPKQKNPSGPVKRFLPDY